MTSGGCWAPTWPASPLVIPRRSCRSCWGTSGGPWPLPPPSSTPACSSPPSVLQPWRRAPRVCGWPCRRPTPRTRSASSSRPSPRWSVSRPDRLVLVAGTGTEVGKTWVTARLAQALGESGARVSARKPAQSFAAGDVETDAVVLGAATGEAPEEVCPRHRWYEVAMAPPMAAETLGRPPFTISDLAAELRFPPRTDFGLVESAGGVRAPGLLQRQLDADVAALVAVVGRRHRPGGGRPLGITGGMVVERVVD